MGRGEITSCERNVGASAPGCTSVGWAQPSISQYARESNCWADPRRRFVRHALVITKQQDRLFVLIEAAHALAQSVDSFGVLDLGFVRLGDWWRRNARLAPSFGDQRRQRAALVDQNPANPGLETRLAGERACKSHDADPRFLHRIASQRAVAAKKAQRQTQQVLLVAAGQRFEGGPVASGKPPEQFLVGLALSWRLHTRIRLRRRDFGSGFFKKISRRVCLAISETIRGASKRSAEPRP